MSFSSNSTLYDILDEIRKITSNQAKMNASLDSSIVVLNEISQGLATTNRMLSTKLADQPKPGN